MDSTADGGDEWLREYARAAPAPGLVVLMQAGEPAVGTIAITRASAGVELGRGSPHGLFAEDAQVSRGHVRVALTAQGQGFRIQDLGSRNGTFLDGVRVEGAVECTAPALLRIGRSLLWLVADIRPFTGQTPPTSQGGTGPIVGGLSRRALGEIAIASKAGDTLLLLGESGAGKELMARAFHEAHFGPDSRAPLVAVNCATVPEGLAERLLFGAKRGAFSGATDSEGYIVEAHGGTLFMDEVAELDPLVQAKLLRVFETREVVALGAVSPRKVSIRICAATHRDMRAEVAAGRFRADLYYRIGRPEVRLPPLRDRLDEVPWLLQRACRMADVRLPMAVTTVESVALRPWPGNVRELLQEARRAAHAALHEGAEQVRPEHFSAEAGLQLGPGVDAAGAAAASGAQPRSVAALDDAAIAAALAENGGNVTRTAKALGLHRNQLRRWVAKHAATLPRSASGSPDAMDDAAGATEPPEDDDDV
ncbi:MAG: sigma 54-interacting transcriptional regulator [Polyangiales bacterium]